MSMPSTQSSRTWSAPVATSKRASLRSLATKPARGLSGDPDALASVLLRLKRSSDLVPGQTTRAKARPLHRRSVRDHAILGEVGFDPSTNSLSGSSLGVDVVAGRQAAVLADQALSLSRLFGGGQLFARARDPELDERCRDRGDERNENAACGTRFGVVIHASRLVRGW